MCYMISFRKVDVCLILMLSILFGFTASAQFTIEPVSVVQAEGLEAVFTCKLDGAFLYNWVFNGDIAAPLPLGAEAYHATDNLPSRLFIPALPQYDKLVVQCESFIREEDVLRIIFSDNTTLKVQEPLSAVTGLHVSPNSVSRSQLTISWGAPFSLDLTTIDPPYIQYCVDVYNVTGGGSHHLDSVCGITDTQYTYTAPDPTGVYNFTVTPRSNIHGSLNGTTSQPVELRYAPRIRDFVTSTSLSPLKILLPSTALSGRPQNYSVMVQPIDKESSDICSCETTESVEKSHDMVAFHLHCQQCDIERHRRYNMTFFAYGLMCEPASISTHDVYKVTYNEVEIVSEYLLDSVDEGFFVIFYSNNHTVYRVAYRNGLESSTTLPMPRLPNNVYRLAVYDLTTTQGFLHPVEHPAVLPGELKAETDNNTVEPPSTSVGSIGVFYKDGFACMICSLSGCVGVIHSAPLDTYNLTVLTARAGEENCTSERFQGELSVAVFEVGERGLNTNPSYQGTIRDPVSLALILGISLPIALVVLVIFVLSVVLLARRHKKATNPAKTNTKKNDGCKADIELDPPAIGSGPPVIELDPPAIPDAIIEPEVRYAPSVGKTRAVTDYEVKFSSPKMVSHQSEDSWVVVVSSENPPTNESTDDNRLSLETCTEGLENLEHGIKSMRAMGCISPSDKYLADIGGLELEQPSFPNQCTDEPSQQYSSTMVHSLGVYDKLAVPVKHKHRALGYMGSEHYRIRLKLRDLVQTNMSGKSMPEDDQERNNLSIVYNGVSVTDFGIHLTEYNDLKSKKKDGAEEFTHSVKSLQKQHSLLGLFIAEELDKLLSEAIDHLTDLEDSLTKLASKSLIEKNETLVSWYGSKKCSLLLLNCYKANIYCVNPYNYTY